MLGLHLLLLTLHVFPTTAEDGCVDASCSIRSKDLDVTATRGSGRTGETQVEREQLSGQEMEAGNGRGGMEGGGEEERGSQSQEGMNVPQEDDELRGSWQT